MGTCSTVAKSNFLSLISAQCEFGCKHGECVGPNKCKCFGGYTGKTCSQGLYGSFFFGVCLC